MASMADRMLGEHVAVGTAYAELEVVRRNTFESFRFRCCFDYSFVRPRPPIVRLRTQMKMFLPLIAHASGRIQFLKTPGTSRVVCD
jgi:hypothetical protein